MKKRLQNICIVLVSFVFFLWRGSAKKVVIPKRFVIIQPTENLGDMVCMTPICHAIKKNNPDAYVAVIGSPKNRELLANHPNIDVYIDIPKSVWQLIGCVRTGKYDAGVVVNPDPVNLGTLFLGNVSTITGIRLSKEFEHMQSMPYRVISHLVRRVEYFPGKYVPDQYLKLLIPFGIEEVSSKKVLFYTTQSTKKVTEMRMQVGMHEHEKFIVIAPGAGSDLKRWPLERFATLANYLYEKHSVPIVIIGGPNDQKVIQDMIKLLDSKVMYWSPGPQSYDELKATLAQAVLVIGNDSGAIHVAEAVGTQTLTIAGSTDVAEHMVEDGHHRIIQGVGDGTLYRSWIGDESQIDPYLARKQMESVSIDSVIKITEELLALNI
jgi:ADP-heptose:LPS heptosyltransferase